MWNFEQLLLTRFQNAKPTTLTEFPSWRAEAAIQATQDGEAILLLFAEDPALLADQDPELTVQYRTAFLEATKPFVEMRYKLATNITIAAAPVSGWTKKVFPDISLEDGRDRFWEAIFSICRVYEQDPVKAWDRHFQDLEGRLEYFNHKKFTGLRFIGPGTDLRMGLPVGHLWQSARMTCKAGFKFSANIPTEEVFTLPHKDQTEGVVSITKPIARVGGITEGAVLTFSEGKVVNVTAKKGTSNLEKIIATDEGHGRLGEVALVPHSSPISQSGLIFYNILFDENASCHIALGSAITASLAGGSDMTKEEFSAAGGNLSIGHLDVMIGSGDLDVDGYGEDGSSEPVMRNGEWAFDI
jgi:aminopeptidase